MALLALPAALLALPAAGVASTSPSKRVVKLEQSQDGGQLLANLRGRTLYSLSVERHGKFICTGGCLSIWHPLVVRPGTRPTGPVKLGTVKRPDGRTQVTYRGRPLYSFGEDSKAGETKGEGIKDVGTWHAARSRSSSGSQGQPAESEQPYPQPYSSTEYPPASTQAPAPSGSQPTSPPEESPPTYPSYPSYGY